MFLRYAILSLLRDEEMHGYRIKSAFEERLGRMWPLNFGQIYTTLKDMKRRDLIVGRLESNGNHMGRWVYGTTARGRRALATWLARRPQPPVPARNEIFVRLLGAWSEDSEAGLAQLKNQEATYRSYLDELKCRRGALEDSDSGENHRGMLSRLTIDATVLQLEAHLRWLDLCGAELHRSSSEARTGTPVSQSAIAPLRKRQRRAGPTRPAPVSRGRSA